MGGWVWVGVAGAVCVEQEQPRPFGEPDAHSRLAGFAPLPSPAQQPPTAFRPASLSPAGLFVTDYFTRTPRKLNAFRSFTSLELFHFRIPEDTAVAVWNLVTFKEQGGSLGDRCPDRSITV